jgi:hypothetical protein
MVGTSETVCDFFRSLLEGPAQDSQTLISACDEINETFCNNC